MYVCHCQVVTDRQVRDAIACGARDLCAIAEACGAGRTCGGCEPALLTMLRDHGCQADAERSAVGIRVEVGEAMVVAVADA